MQNMQNEQEERHTMTENTETRAINQNSLSRLNFETVF